MTDKLIPYCCGVKMEAKRLAKYTWLCICGKCKRQVRVEKEK